MHFDLCTLRTCAATIKKSAYALTSPLATLCTSKCIYSDLEGLVHHHHHPQTLKTSK